MNLQNFFYSEAEVGFEPTQCTPCDAYSAEQCYFTTLTLLLTWELLYQLQLLGPVGLTPTMPHFLRVCVVSLISEDNTPHLPLWSEQDSNLYTFGGATAQHQPSTNCAI